MDQLFALLYILLFFAFVAVIAGIVQKGLDRYRQRNNDRRSIDAWNTFSNSKDGT